MRRGNTINWHSSIGVSRESTNISGNLNRLPNDERVLKAKGFQRVGNKTLIHKTTKALWRLSDDGNYAEPVFGSDELTEEDLKELEGEG